MWSYLLWAIEKSGPTFIKLAQWASTREDLFPAALTNRLVKLQDNTRPHGWKHTSKLLKAALGDWEKFLHIEEQRPIGSGCIAQVYKGTLKSPQKIMPAPGSGEEEEELKAGDENKEEKGLKKVEAGTHVAVKVLHPNIRDNVEADMDIMKSFASFIELFPKLKYLSFRDTILEFEKVLIDQMDLSHEGTNLCRLTENFEDDQDIFFPQPIQNMVSENVLVETFIHGIPVLNFINAEEKVKKELCDLGADAIYRMCFLHNFLHGDLHPGNILVIDREQTTTTAAGRMVDWAKEHLGRSKRRYALAFLDAGMVVELSYQDHLNMVKVLGAFIMRQGHRAGELMADFSKSRDTTDLEGFCAGIQDIVQRSVDEEFFSEMGQYTSDIFALACRHHVKLESKFIATSLAVKVMEGIVIHLNPDIDMVSKGIPPLLKSQIKYGLYKEVLQLKEIYKDLLGSAEKELANNVPQS